MRQRGIEDKPSSELVLHMLNEAGCVAEVADMCNQLPQSDVTRYYLSEALFKTKQADYTASVKLVASNESACDLTQRTKAMLLDGKAKEAV